MPSSLSPRRQGRPKSYASNGNEDVTVEYEGFAVVVGVSARKEVNAIYYYNMLVSVVRAVRSSDAVAYGITTNHIRVSAIQVPYYGEDWLDDGLDSLFRVDRDMDQLPGVRNIEELRERLVALRAEGALRPPVGARIERAEFRPGVALCRATHIKPSPTDSLSCLV